MPRLTGSGRTRYYGESHRLVYVGLRVGANEVVALLGRNGAGKSTTLKSLMGVVTPRSGKVVFDGVDYAGKPSHIIARRMLMSVLTSRMIAGYTAFTATSRPSCRRAR